LGRGSHPLIGNYSETVLVSSQLGVSGYADQLLVVEVGCEILEIVTVGSR
jgi:hypothetical protein